MREGGGEFLDVVVGGDGFALGDEVDGGFGAGFGGGVEVGAEESLEIGFCEGLDVFDVAVDCDDLLAMRRCVIIIRLNLPRSKSKASDAT